MAASKSMERSSPIRDHASCIAELQTRMVLLMINEAARCLEERIVSEPGDVDFAMIMGTGFAPFRGGPLRYADVLGAGKLVKQMDSLVETGARHFAPCGRLREMANTGATFYSEK
jgi:3-hydroxyacyl-CoA dehydrogenase/enoyl-CoA hydratase/3-hydroxybutyryl-CoA epimerase